MSHLPDAPGFERRAYMLDISRDRVPTRATLEWLAGVLCATGFNELQLYVEHTFTYRGHDTVWEKASPLTHDDMGWLDDHCTALGVDLVANMNGFGHMERWLEHEQYRSRAETPEGFESLFGGSQQAPGCMAPTPDNAAFAVDLARDIASTVRHRRLHIGGDEPFELGEGASAADVAARGRDHVYLEHLNRIIEPLVADGHEIMFWADLFRRDASLMAKIPAGAVGVVWNYEAPSEHSWLDFLSADKTERLGLPDDANRGFVAHARLFVESGTPFWVAPGTSTWNSIIGRNTNAAANIADAVAVGRDNFCAGLLLADWGDNGHWQPLAVSLPSIVRCGGAARSGELPSDAEVADTIDEVAGFASGTGRLIDRLGRLGETLGVTSPNGSPLCSVLATNGFPVFGDPDPYAFAAAHDLLGEALATFGRGSVGGPRGDVVAAEMLAACRFAHLGLRRLAVSYEINLAGVAAVAPTPPEIDLVINSLRAAWLLSNRPGGLDDSLARIRL